MNWYMCSVRQTTVSGITRYFYFLVYTGSEEEAKAESLRRLGVLSNMYRLEEVRETSVSCVPVKGHRG